MGVRGDGSADERWGADATRGVAGSGSNQKRLAAVAAGRLLELSLRREERPLTGGAMAAFGDKSGC